MVLDGGRRSTSGLVHGELVFLLHRKWRHHRHRRRRRRHSRPANGRPDEESARSDQRHWQANILKESVLVEIIFHQTASPRRWLSSKATNVAGLNQLWASDSQTKRPTAKSAANGRRQSCCSVKPERLGLFDSAATDGEGAQSVETCFGARPRLSCLAPSSGKTSEAQNPFEAHKQAVNVGILAIIELNYHNQLIDHKASVLILRYYCCCYCCYCWQRRLSARCADQPIIKKFATIAETILQLMAEAKSLHSAAANCLFMIEHHCDIKSALRSSVPNVAHRSQNRKWAHDHCMIIESDLSLELNFVRFCGSRRLQKEWLAIAGWSQTGQRDRIKLGCYQWRLFHVQVKARKLIESLKGIISDKRQFLLGDEYKNNRYRRNVPLLLVLVLVLVVMLVLVVVVVGLLLLLLLPLLLLLLLLLHTFNGLIAINLGLIRPFYLGHQAPSSRLSRVGSPSCDPKLITPVGLVAQWPLRRPQRSGRRKYVAAISLNSIERDLGQRLVAIMWYSGRWLRLDDKRRRKRYHAIVLGNLYLLCGLSFATVNLKRSLSSLASHWYSVVTVGRFNNRDNKDLGRLNGQQWRRQRQAINQPADSWLPEWPPQEPICLPESDNVSVVPLEWIRFMSEPKELARDKLTLTNISNYSVILQIVNINGELTMRKGRQVYDYICIDCNQAKFRHCRRLRTNNDNANNADDDDDDDNDDDDDDDDITTNVIDRIRGPKICPLTNNKFVTDPIGANGWCQHVKQLDIYHDNEKLERIHCNRVMVATPSNRSFITRDGHELANLCHRIAEGLNNRANTSTTTIAHNNNNSSSSSSCNNNNYDGNNNTRYYYPAHYYRYFCRCCYYYYYYYYHHWPSQLQQTELAQEQEEQGPALVGRRADKLITGGSGSQSLTAEWSANNNTKEASGGQQSPPTPLKSSNEDGSGHAETLPRGGQPKLSPRFCLLAVTLGGEHFSASGHRMWAQSRRVKQQSHPLCDWWALFITLSIVYSLASHSSFALDSKCLRKPSGASALRAMPAASSIMDAGLTNFIVSATSTVRNLTGDGDGDGKGGGAQWDESASQGLQHDSSDQDQDKSTRQQLHKQSDDWSRSVPHLNRGLSRTNHKQLKVLNNDNRDQDNKGDGTDNDNNNDDDDHDDGDGDGDDNSDNSNGNSSANSRYNLSVHGKRLLRKTKRSNNGAYNDKSYLYGHNNTERDQRDRLRTATIKSETDTETATATGAETKTETTSRTPLRRAEHEFDKIKVLGPSSFLRVKTWPKSFNEIGKRIERELDVRVETRNRNRNRRHRLSTSAQESSDPTLRHHGLIDINSKTRGRINLTEGPHLAQTSAAIQRSISIGEPTAVLHSSHGQSEEASKGNKDRLVAADPIESATRKDRRVIDKRGLANGADRKSSTSTIVVRQNQASLPSMQVARKFVGSGNNNNLLANSARLMSIRVAAGNELNSRTCPVQCSCVWKNGKHFADCSSSHLTQIPIGLDPLLQVLNLSTSYLVHLPESAFVSLNLNNLQRIYMSSCQMESIHPKAFDNLKLIVELDFSWNKLSFVPLAQMKQLSLMRKLTMRGNPLYKLTEVTFFGGLTRAHSSTGTSAAAAATVATFAAEATTTTSDRFSSGSLFSGLLGESNELSSSSLAAAATIADENLRKLLHRNMSRLFETYPELVRSLVNQSWRLDDNFVIKSNQKRVEKSDRLEVKPEPELELGWEMLRLMVQQEQFEADSNSNGFEEIDADSLADLTSNPQHDEQLEQLSPFEGSNAQHNTLGAHFVQLQELDFGQCKLRYIKWTTLEHLNQLKRLLLDGNQLSQMSGKLVSVLPAGLHQLSLEENPWKCDCRLFSLKRWLLLTRTPLNAPVKCHSMTSSDDQKDGFQQQLQHPRLRKKSPYYKEAHFPVRPDEHQTRQRLVAGVDSDVNTADLVNESETSKLDSIKRMEFLDQLTLDDFVCAPRADLTNFHSTNRIPQLNGQSKLNTLDTLNPNDEHHHRPPLNTIYDYLWPTFIKPEEADLLLGNEINPSGQTPTFSSRRVLTKPSTRHYHHNQHRELIQATEDDRVTLKCSLLAYPESSLDVIWLVDYSQQHTAKINSTESTELSSLAAPMQTQINKLAPDNSSFQQRQRQIQSASVGRLPAEERFIVLYDSKLHRPITTNNSVAQSAGREADPPVHNHAHPQHFAFNEVSLYGSRIIIRETRSSINPYESIFKESQIIIQSAHINDSARYKCIGLNKAGNISVEYLLRISQSSSSSSSSDMVIPSNSPKSDTISAAANRATNFAYHHHIAAGRDQRAYGSSQQQQEMANKARLHAAQSSQPAQGTGAGASVNADGSGWLKSSTTFQITMVVVSTLMAAVILAFLIFCIIIYQIKPSPGRPSELSSLASASAAQKEAANRMSMVHNRALSLTGPNCHRLVVGVSARSTFDSLAGHESMYVGSQTTPLLAAVCDPLTGQSPVHLLARPTAPTAISQMSISGQPMGSTEESVLTWNVSGQPLSVAQIGRPQAITRTLDPSQ